MPSATKSRRHDECVMACTTVECQSHYMPVASLNHVSLAFGHLPLLDDALLQIEAGERVSLVGRNGTGKSTLLQILSGEQRPDTRLGVVSTGIARRPARAGRAALDQSFGGRRRRRRARRAQRAGGELPPHGAPCGRRQHAGAARQARGAAARARVARRLAHRGAHRAGAVPSRPCRRRPASTRCLAAGGAACCWRARWSRSRICCCSTSRPTTSTSTPSTGSRNFWRSTPAPWCS